MKFFINNFNELNTFHTDTIKAVLLHNYEYNPEHRYVVDVSTNELTDASYNRLTLNMPSRVVDSANRKIIFSAESPNFSFIENESVNGMVLYKEITNDLDSKILFYWEFDTEHLDGSTAFTVTFDPGGIMTIFTGA